MGEAESTRWTVLYSGHVQGVGFRATTLHLARRFDVTGTVRNLPDGRVEVVMEGRPEELEAFQAAIAGEFSGYIRDAQTAASPATGTFSGFQIRH